MAGALAPFSYLWAERTLSARPRTRARTLRLLSLVACKFTVVGGRGFTGPCFFSRGTEYRRRTWCFLSYPVECGISLKLFW
jgi:hypothetical protein